MCGNWNCAILSDKMFLESLLSKSYCTLHHRVMGFLYDFSCIFFSLQWFFLIFSNLKGIICTPKFCNKNIGNHAGLRANDKTTSLPGPFIENNSMFLEFPRWPDFDAQYRIHSAIMLVSYQKIILHKQVSMT